MDRINIQCEIDGQLTNLQLDKKNMPGETGPCYMITADGCFKGYVARQKNGTFRSIHGDYFSQHVLQGISEQLNLASR